MTKQQIIAPFSITVLHDRPDVAVAHDLECNVAVEVRHDGPVVFEGPAGISWSAYQNNGGNPLIAAQDVEFQRHVEE